MSAAYLSEAMQSSTFISMFCWCFPILLNTYKKTADLFCLLLISVHCVDNKPAEPIRPSFSFNTHEVDNMSR